jgi:hypothetical protein
MTLESSPPSTEEAPLFGGDLGPEPGPSQPSPASTEPVPEPEPTDKQDERIHPPPGLLGLVFNFVTAALAVTAACVCNKTNWYRTLATIACENFKDDLTDAQRIDVARKLVTRCASAFPPKTPLS